MHAFFTFHKLTLIASAGLMLALSLSATAPSLGAPSNQKVRSQVQEFKNNEVRKNGNPIDPRAFF